MVIHKSSDILWFPEIASHHAAVSNSKCVTENCI